MKAALYARVSDAKQDIDLSISTQLKGLREYALHNGYDVVREFVDEAESGRTDARPAFREMIALARRPNKSFSAILVWKYSRFARSREDSILYKAMLKKAGVLVISINEPFDNSPTGLSTNGHIENLDAPAAYPVGGSGRIRIPDTNLGQAHRIDGGTVTCHSIGDRLSGPLTERRVRVEGVDKYVGVQKDHGSRVSSRSFSHGIVGRRGALRMASIHAFLVIRSACSGGFSSLISRKRPSSCCWMSKISPGRPFGRTIRFLVSTVDVLMVGLSHMAYLLSRVQKLLYQSASG